MSRIVIDLTASSPPSSPHKPRRPPPPSATLGHKSRAYMQALTAEREKQWAPENLCSRNSPLITADLTTILNADTLTRSNLTPEEYDSLLALLPADDILYPSSLDPSIPDGPPVINPALFASAVFQDSIVRYQEALAAGRYEPEYIARGKEAKRRRVDGEFDAWKEARFEACWGDRRRVFFDEVAGASCRVSLQEMVKTHCFRIGDVFSVRRRFAGGVEVRKEAVLTGIDLRDGALEFAYPPGTAVWHRDDVEDKTVKGVVSLTAFENMMCAEHGGVPARLPNGNAWKTVCVVRSGELLGRVFDLRLQYWTQYYGDIEEGGS